MTGLKEKQKDEFVSKTREQLLKYQEENQKRIIEKMKKYANGPKIRTQNYKSENDTQRFVKYLKKRLEKWEEDKTIYGRKMYEKTKKIINNLESRV